MNETMYTNDFSAVLFGLTMAVLAAAICIAVAVCCLTRARTKRRNKTAYDSSVWPGMLCS